MNDDRDFNDFDFVSAEFREPFFASRAMQNLDSSAGKSRLDRNLQRSNLFKDNLDLQQMSFFKFSLGFVCCLNLMQLKNVFN